MSVNLRDVIKKMLASYGLEIIDRDDDYIWIRKKDGLYLMNVEEENFVDGDYIVNFSRKTEQFHGNKGIVCLKGYDKNAESLAKKMGIELTSREEIAGYLGEYFLTLYENKRFSEVPILGEEDVEVEDIEVEEEEEEQEDVIPIFLEEVGDGEEKIIKIGITREDALKIARDYVNGFRVELKLIPYYIFEFSLELKVEGNLKNKMVKGIISINALDGKYEIWKTGYEITSTIEIPHERLEPSISLKEAEKIVVDGLKKEYTKEGEFKIEEENITIIEKRKIQPKEESINKNFMGLYYLPVWVIEGRNGLVMINAATGKIIKENVYGSKI